MQRARRATRLARAQVTQNIQSGPLTTGKQQIMITTQIGGYLRAGQRTRTPIGASGCAASGSAAGTTGIRNPQSWRGVSGRRWILPGMARFEDQDLTGAEFRECDLTRARLIGVVMQDAVIDGLIRQPGG